MLLDTARDRIDVKLADKLDRQVHVTVGGLY